MEDSLDYLKRDKSTVDETCHVWTTLLKDQSTASHSRNFETLNQAMRLFQCLAYLLKPKYRGVGLTII